jgi:2-dehydropantoate 2-reductase
MNIVIMGAGAIGSLFGALLSKNNNVVLIGRKPHVSSIKKSGLTIEGKTELNVNIASDCTVDNINFTPDLIILTVKSYDSELAIMQAWNIINNDSVVLSLQNGLDNIDKIKNFLYIKNIIAGVTTHGAFISKPGIIKHTGEGITVLGEIDNNKTKRIFEISKIFNDSGIQTTVSDDIIREIWLKAIVNSCVNPITALFQCKNGYLLENPILEKLIEKICQESIKIACTNGINVSYEELIKKTKKVIRFTSENYSSMLQSIFYNKKTEIDSINGKLVEIGKENNVDTIMNEMLVYSIKSFF